MNRCLEEDELIDLLDGGVAPNREEPLLRHLRDCRKCTSRKASLGKIVDGLARHAPFDPVAHAERVARAIDEAESEASAPAPAAVPLVRRGGARVAAIATVAVAASVATFVATRSTTQEPWIAPRGAPSSNAQPPPKAAVRHAAGIDLWAAESGTPRGLGAGDAVSASTRYQATYRNLGRVPVNALLFALDSRGTIHWLYPAYETPGTDPPSVVLAPTAGKDAPLPTSVVLDAPAEGPLVVFSVLSLTPLRVSSIEDRHDLSLESLRRAFPDADVESIPLVLVK